MNIIPRSQSHLGFLAVFTSPANVVSIYSIKNVKSTIPADRLCLIQLEDGIDWDTICPYLGVPVPKEEYPDRNQPERFEYLLNEFLQPRVRTAMLRCGAVAVAAIGIIGWAAITSGPSLLPRFMGISPP